MILLDWDIAKLTLKIVRHLPKSRCHGKNLMCAYFYNFKISSYLLQCGIIPIIFNQTVRFELSSLNLWNGFQVCFLFLVSVETHSRSMIILWFPSHSPHLISPHHSPLFSHLLVHVQITALVSFSYLFLFLCWIRVLLSCSHVGW